MPLGGVWEGFGEDLGGSWEDFSQFWDGFWRDLGKNLGERVEGFNSLKIEKIYIVKNTVLPMITTIFYVSALTKLTTNPHSKPVPHHIPKLRART